jgi:hypothetical protein
MLASSPSGKLRRHWNEIARQNATAQFLEEQPQLVLPAAAAFRVSTIARLNRALRATTPVLPFGQVRHRASVKQSRASGGSSH